MADGAGGIGKQIGDSLKDIGKDLTVNLAKDMFDQIAGGKPAPPNTQTQSGSSPQMYQAQKNIQMANISRRIQQFAQRRRQVSQQSKQKEDQRVQTIQNEKQQKIQEAEGKGMGSKVKDMFANFGATLARRGKGEQRGNKSSG
ncbi:MAG: hypothetical protein M3Q44_06785 [bacterium]|nr:hypothetical protein [bacterium]